MARPRRIEFPNAYYHVSNRSAQTAGLFPTEAYYQAFLEGLAEAAERFNVQILGWCLLKHEYHLMLKTPEGNLSRFMRQVDGLYTQHYQRLKRRHGSVFKSRYKSVLFQPEQYLLPLSRYLHNLPKRSRQNPQGWAWSSLRYYLDSESHARGFFTEEILTPFGRGAAARDAYANYVARGTDRELLRFYGKKNQQSVLGDAAFRDRVKNLAAIATVVGTLPFNGDVRRRPSAHKIVNSVADTFKVSGNSILRAARGPGSKNVPRWVAMYLCQEAGGITLQQIATQFGLQRYGTVSTTIGKLKEEFEENPPLESRVRRIRQSLAQ